MLGTMHGWYSNVMSDAPFNMARSSSVFPTPLTSCAPYQPLILNRQIARLRKLSIIYHLHFYLSYSFDPKSLPRACCFRAHQSNHLLSLPPHRPHTQTNVLPIPIPSAPPSTSSPPSHRSHRSSSLPTPASPFFPTPASPFQNPATTPSSFSNDPTPRDPHAKPSPRTEAGVIRRRSLPHRPVVNGVLTQGRRE